MNSVVSSASSDVRQRLHLAWLIKLRWAASLGQSLTVIVTFWLLGLALPIRAMMAALVLTSSTNLVLCIRQANCAALSDWWARIIVTLDVLLLTIQLYCSGGSTNPFCFLYLIHMALAAVILSPRWVLLEVVLSGGCFIYLTHSHVPMPLSSHLYQQGLVAAYLLAAGFIVYFTHRLHVALNEKQELLAATAARGERLSSLATLAAGAAHELCTPLATIAVVSKELEHRIASLDEDHAAIEDAQLIRHEVERCRTVLSHMAADAGTHSGEPFVEISVADLIEATLDGLAQRKQVKIDVHRATLSQLVKVPQRSVAQAVRGIAKNAFDASSSHSTVRFAVSCERACLHLTIEDRGTGMSPEVLARAGEPFFTTKGPGRGPGGGMGLGLFLARTLFEDIGGELRVNSALQTGTQVHMVLPLNTV